MVKSQVNLILKFNTSPLRRLLDELAAAPGTAMEVGAEAVYEFLRDYHSGMDWKGSRWIPGPNSGEFAKAVVEGWQPPVISGRAVEITNTFGLLAWKVSGGAISAKRAPFLTIPLTSATKGRSVAQYRGETGDTVFRAGNALCRRIGKKLEALYAVKEAVTQAPWPDAMPPTDKMRDAFSAGVRAAVNAATKAAA